MVPAEYLPLPLTEHRAVHPLVTELAREAGLVEGLPGGPHHLGDEDGLVAPGGGVVAGLLLLDVVTWGKCRLLPTWAGAWGRRTQGPSSLLDRDNVRTTRARDYSLALDPPATLEDVLGTRGFLGAT